MKMFKNEEEYNKAIDLLEQIGDRDGFQDNKELIAQFELLSSMIEAYEVENVSLSIGNPIEIIKLKMNYLDLKQKDLQPYIGSSGIVSEVLNKKRGLSKNMIRGLSEFLHLDQDLLNTPYDLVESSKKTKENTLSTIEAIKRQEREEGMRAGMEKGVLKGKIQMLKELGYSIIEVCKKLSLTEDLVTRYYTGS